MKIFLFILALIIGIVLLLSSICLKESVVFKLINDSMKLNDLEKVFPKLRDMVDFCVEYPQAVKFDVTDDVYFMKALQSVLNTSNTTNVKENLAELINNYSKENKDT